MSYNILKKIFFKLDPEISHKLALTLLKYTPKFYFKQVPDQPTRVMGLNFPNPVGLAAGLDKNGDYIDALAKLGFGFIEIGTVTPRPQLGSPKPRLFRLPEKEAIINRMGFNSKGVEHVVKNLKQVKYHGILGINIGKNADTSIENAVEDYLLCFRKVYPYAHYITVNISSPNTPGLRRLQFGEHLNHLLTTLKAEQQKLNKQLTRYVPLVIKIAPDLTEDEIKLIAESLLQHEVDAVIATNTTSSREGIDGARHADELGGLSGTPLTAQATHVVKALAENLQEKLPIIAAGGIMSGEDAKEKFAVGASLIQLYTGLIYKGPNLICDCIK